MWCATKFNFGSTALPQAVDSELLLYVDDTCLTFQHKEIKNNKETSKQGYPWPKSRLFSLIDCFVDKKMSVNFSEGKTKSAFSSPKHK